MNYGFYKSAFGGTLIPPELFNRFLLKATAYFESVTQKRPVPPEFEEQASMALCEIAETFMKHSQRCGVKSESTDGYSVSYDETTLNSQLSGIMTLYLGESDILFKGEL